MAPKDSADAGCVVIIIETVSLADIGRSDIWNSPYLINITEKQMEKLIKELQVKIVEVLNLIDVQPEDIGTDDQLVGGKLGIDSIDVLEMVIMIEKDYGVKIDNRELGVKVFATLGTLADYIHKSSPELPN